MRWSFLDLCINPSTQATYRNLINGKKEGGKGKIERKKEKAEKEKEIPQQIPKYCQQLSSIFSC